MKILKSIISLLALICILNCSVYAEERVGAFSVQGFTKEAPFSGQFWLAEGGDSFILLDEKDGKYLILCGSDYGLTVFDEENSQKYDTEKQGNIGYFLTHNVQLPENIEKYIVPSEWEIEAGIEKGDCPTTRTITSKLSLLSATELKNYYKKIGYSDKIGGDWWLRSPDGTGGDPSLALFCAETGSVKAIASKNEKYVRPVFWLDKEFFKNEKLEVLSMGSDIKKLMNKLNTESDYERIGYSQQQIKMIKSNEPGVTEKVEYIEPEGWCYKLLSLSDNTFQLKFYTNGQDTAVYKIVYTLEGEDAITKSVTVTDESIQSFTLPAKYGSFQLNIQVFSGGRRVYNKNHTVAFMPPYEHQFMEYFSRKGVATHGYLTALGQMTDQDLDYMEAAGIKYYRDELPWNCWEYPSGWNPPASWTWIFPRAAERGIRHYNLVTGPNALYQPPGGDSTWAPADRKGYEGFANYAVKNQNEKPGEIVEVCNEPNINGFWKPTPNIDNYTSLLKTAYSNLRLNFPDLEIYGFVTAGTDLNFINKGIELGAYPYFTGIAFHPYCYPLNAVTEEGCKIYTDTMNVYNIILANGGWKDMSASEIGWPTSYGMNTQEEQARNLIELYTIGDWAGIRYVMYYDMQCDGESDLNKEHQFGLYDLNSNPKKGFVALGGYNRIMAGAVYHGKISLNNGDYAFVYSKNKKPVIVAWNINGSTYDFGSDSVVYDMYGNLIQNGGEVQIGINPIYITNLEDSWFERAAYEGLRDSQNNWLNKYTDKIGHDAMVRVSGTFKKGIEAVESGDVEKITKVIDSYTELGNEIYNAMNSGVLTKTESFASLYELSKVVDYLYNYISVLPISESYQDVADRAIENAQNSVTAGYERVYSSGILRFARRAYNEAKEVSALEDNPAKAGIVSSWNLKAVNLLKWYNLFAPTEQENNLCVDMVWDDQNKTAFDGEKKNFHFSSGNYSENDISARVEIYDDADKCIGTSEEMIIPSKSSVVFSCEAVIEKEGISDKKHLRCRIVSGGKILYEYSISMKINELLLTEIVPAEKVVSELKALNLKVSNPYDQKNTAKITLFCPYIDFEESSQKVEVESGTSEVVEYKISSIQNTEYHYYPVTIALYDNDGNKVSEKTELWNFHIITKTRENLDVSTPLENIEAWKNAYPVYIDMPKNPTDKTEWRTSEASARVLVMWDENNVYMLADVFDHLYRNFSTGVTIWEGDCVQIAIDSLMSRGDYNTMATEEGIALTPYGTNVYAWMSANGEGSRPDSNGSVLRSEYELITRYQLKVPVEDLKSKEIKLGNKMGLNFAINDSDEFLRDYMTQYAPGLVENKSLAKVPAFSIVDDNAEAGVKTQSPFPDDLAAESGESDENTASFADIDGHWAYAQITRLVSEGIVKGVSENEFNPEGIVTRAEFIAMVLRTLNISEAEYDNTFSDVSGDEWYANILEAASDNGILDEHFIVETMVNPNKPITREEMTLVLYNADLYQKRVFPIYNEELSVFIDKDDISEFAKTSVGAMYMDSVVSGYGDKTFKPKNNATRAEASTIIYNYIIR